MATNHLTRRDFLKTSLAVSGFISIGGILVPKNSEAASPLVGVILTSMLQAMLTYLAYRSQYKLSLFKEQYDPYDQTNILDMNIGDLRGGISQNLLYSHHTKNPISNFKNTYDGNTVLLNQGSAFLNNGKLDPDEFAIAEKYERATGYSLFPIENRNTAHYNIPTIYQRDYIKEREKDDPIISQLGGIGENYFIQGVRKFGDDKGNNVLMAKFTKKGYPQTLRTFLAA